MSANAKEPISRYASTFLFPFKGEVYLFRSLGFGKSYLVDTGDQKTAIIRFLDNNLRNQRIVFGLITLIGLAIWLRTQSIAAAWQVPALLLILFHIGFAWQRIRLASRLGLRAR